MFAALAAWNLGLASHTAVWRADAAAFLLCLGVLVAVWLLYPCALWLQSQWAPAPPACAAETWSGPAPRLSVIVAAHNEGAVIDNRLRNLYAQGYPRECLEVIVTEDGSTDDTAERVRRWPQVRLLSTPTRVGKNAALNRAVASSHGEVIVFTDANNIFLPGTLQALAAPFADARVGAVTGRKSVSAACGVGGGESIYWRYEGWLTALETATGSTVAGFGEILALRRVLYTTLPVDAMVNDDLFLTLHVLAQRRRVVSAPDARSCEAAAASDGAEWERRRRMAVGRWQALAGLRGQWRQFRGGDRVKIAFHEAGRPVSALMLALAAASGCALLPAGTGVPAVVRVLALMQAAVLGWVLVTALARWSGWRLGRAEAPYFFCLGLAASLAGGWRYLRRRQSPLWTRVARAPLLPVAPAADPEREPVAVADAGLTAGHVLQSLFWACGSFFGGKLLVFASVMVLARLLDPQDFGSVALASSTILVLEIFGTLGLTSALIYQQTDENAPQTCFCLTVAASFVTTTLACAIAGPLARFFHDPQLAPLLRVLSLSLVLTALGNTHDTLLRRQLAFHRKIIPDLGMAAMKGLIAIVLAVYGLGAWSLIWGQVLGSAVGTALLWQITPWRPARRWSIVAARRMFTYSKHIYLLDCTSTVLMNLDALVIGRMLGDYVLGFYSLAFRIPEVLLLSILNVVTRVIFPALSRLQDDLQRLRTTLLETARYTALFSLPLAAGLVILARELLLAFYGWTWLPAAPVLRVLALYGGLRCLAHHFGDAYKAIGRPDVLAKVTALWWLLLPPSLILGAHWGGIAGVAWGQVTTRLAMTGVHVYLVYRVLGIAPAQLWRCFAPAFESTAVMSLGIWFLYSHLPSNDPRTVIAVVALAGGALYMLYLRLRFPGVLSAAGSQLRSLPRTRAESASGLVTTPAVAAGEKP